MTIEIAAAEAAEAEDLADIRVEAMRPSLEALGRFDPERARRRFLSTFVADETFVIRLGAERVGFYVLRRRPDHLCLDHLYIRPAFQGRGIGREIVGRIQADADARALPVHLVALTGSGANAFYRAYGLKVVGEDGVDIRYRWRTPE